MQTGKIIRYFVALRQKRQKALLSVDSLTLLFVSHREYIIVNYGLLGESRAFR